MSPIDEWSDVLVVEYPTGMRAEMHLGGHVLKVGDSLPGDPEWYVVRFDEDGPARGTGWMPERIPIAHVKRVTEPEDLP